MTSKNALMLVAGLVTLMGVWSFLATYAGLPNLGVTDPWWHAALKVVLGGFGLYVAYNDK